MNDLLMMSSTIIITVTGWLVIGQCLKIVSLADWLACQDQDCTEQSQSGRDSIKHHCKHARGCKN